MSIAILTGSLTGRAKLHAAAFTKCTNNGHKNKYRTYLHLISKLRLMKNVMTPYLELNQKKNDPMINIVYAGNGLFATTLNQGEEDEMEITGYKKSKLRTALCWICFVLTLGLLRLFMHWRHHWLLIATHVPCPLNEADMVLISEYFEKRYTMYYVQKVFHLESKTNW